MHRIHGYARNDPASVKWIAEGLRHGPVFFSWTDGATHHDIYMIPSRNFGTIFEAPDKIQAWERYGMVVVGIERIGCFYFDLLSGKESFHEDYVTEKLFGGRGGQTPRDIAELLTLISAEFAPHGRNLIV